MRVKAGRIVGVVQPQPGSGKPHVCKPPRTNEFATNLVHLIKFGFGWTIENGTVWQCDCGKAWMKERDSKTLAHYWIREMAYDRCTINHACAVDGPCNGLPK